MGFLAKPSLSNFGDASTASNTKRKYALTKEQKHMYASETLVNFRWISKIMASYSPHKLSSRDIPPLEVTDYLSEIGQFAEITYSPVPTKFIFDNLAILKEPGFPLEGYDSLDGATQVSEFIGKAADLSGYVTYRPQTRQLVLAFSGTTTMTQAMYDLRVAAHRHPSRRGHVHSGFWQLYKGIKALALEAVVAGLAQHADVSEFVVTGHSMGGAVAYLFLIDVFRDEALLPIGAVPVKLVVFGVPRSGNEELAQFWTELLESRRAKYGEASITEYSVKAYNDGVPSLPPLSFGYRHYARAPFYFLHGRLYQVPEEHREHGLFHVNEAEEDDHVVPQHPRGGHNYYNGRDMEKFARRAIWLEEALRGEGDWKERYRAKVAKHS
ncbi:triacylglycerol lipase [Favolaschia claudopus]|uniref:Triacylglycerol lipase n=1 Tax=Favolaschia claudopus TaxID=2862362 RepID=A0AAW0CY46_9AGAR